MLPLPKLYEVVRRTMEEMAFLDVADGPSPEASAPEEGPVLYLEYSRPTSGALALFLPKEIKFQIVEAIYGETYPSLSPVQLDDSLLELLNVLAGRLLAERFGAGKAYTMGLPTVLYESPEVPPGFDHQRYTFHVDSWELTLIWYEVAS